MSAFIDMTGRRFGRWTVLRRSEKCSPHGKGRVPTRKHWVCRCDCGRECHVGGRELRSGNSKQCKACGHGVRGRDKTLARDARYKHRLGASFHEREIAAVCQLFEHLFTGKDVRVLAKHKSLLVLYGKFQRMRNTLARHLAREAQQEAVHHAAE